MLVGHIHKEKVLISIQTGICAQRKGQDKNCKKTHHTHESEDSGQEATVTSRRVTKDATQGRLRVF